MIKNALKRFFAVSCVAILLMTTSGMMVLADEIEGEEVILADISEDESVQEELPVENTQEYKEDEYIDTTAEDFNTEENTNNEDIDKENQVTIESEIVEESTDSEESVLEEVSGSSLTSIVIPDGVTSIWSYEYSDCTSLTDITIPDSVTSIGEYAFRGCESLTSITIPNSVTYISGGVFYGCSSLKSATIPVDAVHYSIFSGCSSLEKIEAVSENGISWIIEKKDGGACQITFSGEGDIPDYETGSGYWEYEDAWDFIREVKSPWLWIPSEFAITDIIIENGVTGIGKNAFNSCRSLESVTMPNSVTSISSSAFSGCNNLKTIIMSDNITSIDNSAFEGCSNLISINIPDSVTSIGSSAFSGCSSLTTMIISGGLTTIPEQIFYNCGNLTSITIPDSVVTIEKSAFNGCVSLTSFTIPNSVKTISENAFYNCSALQNISIPESVETIGENAFDNCSSLTNVSIPANITSYRMFSGCVEIEKIEGLSKDNIGWLLEKTENGSFQLIIKGKGIMPDYEIYSYYKEVYYDWEYDWESETILVYENWPTSPWSIENFNITDVVIEDGVENIGAYAFYKYNALRSVTIPDSVTEIGGAAFKGCAALSDVNIPNSITNVPDEVFACCENLSNIELPGSVTRIGSSAFSGCTSLSNIVIPNSVIRISEYAFAQCSNLKTINIPDSVKYIESSAFCKCGCLTNISLPSNIRILSDQIFTDCTSLKEITIPENVCEIGYSTFMGCTSLETLVLNGTYRTIESSAFRNLPALKSVIINAPIEEIGSYSFSDCPNLQSIRLPNTLKKVCIGAFKDDTALSTVYYGGSSAQWKLTGIADYNEPLLNANVVISYDISRASIYTKSDSYVYTGTPRNPSPVISLDGKTLVKGTDYDLTYQNDLNVGTATVTAHGKGDYTGTISCTFKITPRDISDGTASTKSKEYPYKGTPRCPDMILVVNSITLVKDVDYTLTYENNIEIGTATVIAHGIGNYAGEISCTFEIVNDGPVSIATAEIYTKSESYVYTGTPRDPSPIITLDGKTLVKGTDYDLTYENDLNVGTATVIAHGKGDYTGTVSCTYGITPRDISEGTASTKSKTYAFNGKPRHPAMILVVNNRTLVKDIDYTLTYENDTEVGTATVTAHGIGNYAGEKSCTYGIVIVKPTTIQYAQITTKSPSYVYTGTPRDPSPIITLGGKTLVKGTDYDLSYKNDLNVGTATVTATGKGDYKGTVSCTYGITPRDISDGTASTKSWAYLYTGTPRHPALTLVVNNKTLVKDKDFTLSYENDIEPGTATMTATGIGNYQGQKSYTFEILAEAIDISGCSVSGNSLSYGYSGKAYTPNVTVKLDGTTLTKDTDYTVTYKNNTNPGTASITVTGKGIYKGTRIKTFEIVDCVSSLVSGKTYQLIPKNNSKTAVSSFGGKMVNNTKVYITDRSNSEAMKFKAIQNADGTWKFINAKCELAFAVRSNSSDVGKELVLYDQTTKKQQNWKLTKKSDNSFGIINAVSGLYVAMSDDSAVKGTTLSMEENSGRGQQRFYIAETTAVSAPFDGTRAVKASKNKSYAVSIASASKEDGANVNLAAYSNSNDKKFNIIYSGGGYYRLVNVNSKLVLTVKDNSTVNGANVIQSAWAGESGQRWKFKKNADGTVTLTNALGTVLHLNGNKTANGTNIIAKTASTTGAQKWYLE